MKRWLELLSRVTGGVFSAIGSFALWTVWLALMIVLCFQLYIVTANELAIPDFVLRQVESRLEQSGIRATFSRTSFDPAGRVLIEDLKLFVPTFAEPVITARSAYVRLNPWLLAVGRLEPREVRLTEVNAFVPAMLSRSGRAEEVIRNLDATIEPRRRAVVIRQLSASVTGVPVTARGTFTFQPSADRMTGMEKLEEFVQKQFPQVCRQALAFAEQVSRFDDLAVRLEFAPSESGATAIHVRALAGAVRFERPYAVEASNLRASTRLLLFGDAPPTHVDVAADEIRLPQDIRIAGLRAQIAGRVQRTDTKFDLREIAATADSVVSADVDLHAVAARIYPRPWPAIETQIVANVLGAPLALRGNADLAARHALVQFEGAISPRVLDVISHRLSVDVRKYINFDAFTAEQAEARFGDNWQFEKLTARIRTPRIDAYGVVLEDGRAEVELDPHRFHSPDAFARVGDNFARGSYDHDLKTHAYRFLLAGRLRPLAISEWFHEWWTDFFQQLEFPVTAPIANVDVRGTWHDGRESNVFVWADVPKAIIRGTELDRVRTRMFIRPAFYDGLEVLALRGAGNAHGRFTYIGDPETHAWHTLELGLDSTLDLSIAASLLGPAGARSLAPFRLAQPPELKVRGQFAGPDAPGGESEKLHIQARTVGDFRFHDFPLQDVSFVATIDREDIVLDDVEALFAGGTATGHARVTGVGDERRLGFDLALQNASLGKLAAGLSEFFAARKGEAPTPPGKFVREKADVQLNLAASAEGRYDDPLSYRGEGNAVLHGAEIGEVPLLGTLSELLKFTALRFNEARGNFRIEQTRLVFPEVTLRGANSAVDAHGTYALDRRELEFNARIFPFQESENLIKTMVGAVLTPLSNALEVKLTGSLAKPQWAFVMGPTNFLRALTPAGDAEEKRSSPAGANEATPPRTSAKRQRTPLPRKQ